MSDQRPEPGRDVVGHLEKSAREFIAAAREALDYADEVLAERMKLLGAWFEPRPRADAAPKVEKIPVVDDAEAGRGPAEG